MQLNDLYRNARTLGKSGEEPLFKHLSVSFRLITQYRIRNRSDSEDIAQEAMMTVAMKFKELDIDINFGAWAYRVLKNKILDYYKSSKKSTSSIEDLGEKGIQLDDFEFNPMLRGKLLDCLKKINSANSNFARILNLRFQGYSTDEICSILKVSANNFYVILYRARIMLERCLETGEI